MPTVSTFQSLLLVACGGALGAVMRALLAIAATQLHMKAVFATLAANVIGCLAAGLLLGATKWATEPQHSLRFLIMVGVLGGLTTFSAFSVETVTLVKQGENYAAFGNIAANLCLGFGAVWLGMVVGGAIPKAN